MLREGWHRSHAEHQMKNLAGEEGPFRSQGHGSEADWVRTASPAHTFERSLQMCGLEVDRAALSALPERGATPIRASLQEDPGLPALTAVQPKGNCHPTSDANLSSSESARPPSHRLHRAGWEATRAGHWDWGLYPSLETLLRLGLPSPIPCGPKAELGAPSPVTGSASDVPSSGLGSGTWWRTKPGMTPANQTADLMQITHTGTYHSRRDRL